MESAPRCPSEKPRALGPGKASHAISKLAGYGGSSSPTIRIVHIFAPKVIKTDAANFRSLVQKLTGKSSAKCRASRAVQKSGEKTITDGGRMRSPGDDTNSGAPPRGSQSAAPANPSAKMEENPEFLCFQEYPFGSEFGPLAGVKAEVLEEAANPWDNLAGFFGGFGELDILLNSEFPCNGTAFD